VANGYGFCAVEQALLDVYPAQRHALGTAEYPKVAEGFAAHRTDRSALRSAAYQVALSGTEPVRLPALTVGVSL